MKDTCKVLTSIPDESIKNLLIDFFSDARHGTPDNITKNGCLNLAKYGFNTWNTWRTLFPPRPSGFFHHKNISDFSHTDFDNYQHLTFAHFIFGDGADFSYCKWERYADFFSARWGDHCKFTGTDWGVRSTFDLVTIGDNSDFTGCHWGHDCAFDKATIGSNANFSNTYWNTRTYFNETHFDTSANFELSIWNGTVSFSGTGACGLSNTTALYPKDERTPLILEAKSSNSFSKISFKGAKFKGEVFFDDRIFTDATDFSSFSEVSQCQLVQRNPDRSAVITDGALVFIAPENPEDIKTVFSYPPSFHSAKLHSNTSFDGAKFPEPEGSMYNARAYRTLKTLFGQIQSESDAKFFKRLEIAEELAYKRRGGDQPSSAILLEIVETTRTSHNIRILAETLNFKLSNIILDALKKIDDHLLSERWADAATNTRKILEACVGEIADRLFSEKSNLHKLAKQPKKPIEIRLFLNNIGFISKSELNLINAAYGFLSEVGAHPHNTTPDQANLAVTNGLALAEFVLQKARKEVKSD